jgi:hypothetical protein
LPDDPRADVCGTWVGRGRLRVFANDIYLGPEVLTLVIPLGTFCVFLLLAFFYRRPDQ